ncbi:MAG: ABC transporter permease subunit [candidate division KSB1 bacterium]|nr:ABC transporter permease subunit [candidate division KSB1 bacterium]
MRNFFAILEKELKSYFVSPLAYVVLGFFVVVTGLFFYNIINWFDRMSMQSMIYAQQYRQAPPPVNVNAMAIRPLFHNITIISLFLVPGLTMRLFAEEKRQGTMELLATSPLSNWQITLGKFASALLFFLTMLAATGVFIGLLFFFGNPEGWPILSGYAGLLFIGGCFIAVGMLCSAFTENQIIAFVSALALNLVFLTLGWLSTFVGPTLASVFSALSPLEHFDDFSKGVIDTKHIVFYLSFMFGGIFLTYVTVESARWRGMR